MNPSNLSQDWSVLDDVLIRREQHLELAHPDLVLQRTTLLRVALVRDHIHTRCPLRKLAGPICHGRQRDNDEVRATLLLGLDEERDQRDRLDSLSETLFVFR